MAHLHDTQLQSADAHAHAGEHEGPDEWHTHTADEGRPMDAHTASVDITVLLKWLVGLLVALVIVILAVVKFFEVTRLEYLREQVETNVLASDYTQFRAKLDQELSASGQERRFVGVEGNKVQGPIDDGMEKVISAYANGTASLPAMHTATTSEPPASKENGIPQQQH